MYCVTHCSYQCHYGDQIWDGEVGKMAEQSSEWVVERGGNEDVVVVIGTKEDCSGQGNLQWWVGQQGGVQQPDGCTQTLPSKMIAWLSWFWATAECTRWRMIHFMDWTEKPLWSMLIMEPTLVSMVYCPWLYWSWRFIRYLWHHYNCCLCYVHDLVIQMSMVCAGAWNHVDVHWPCCRRGHILTLISWAAN